MTGAAPTHEVYAPARVIREIAAARGWAVEDLDPFSGRAARIDNGRGQILWIAGAYPGNDETAARLARDKAHAGEILRRAGVKIPQGEHFFITPDWADERPPGREIPDALAYANGLGYPVFVKPLAAAFGSHACVIADADALARHFVAMARDGHYGAMVQTIVPGTEHRVFVVDGRARFAYRKRPLALVGDGVRPVSDLLAETLAAPGVFAGAPDAIAAMLAAAGVGQALVLAAGETLFLSDNANPNAGARIDDVRATLPPAAAAWAARAVDAVGLRVGAVDFFAPQSLDDPPAEFTALEVNASPALKTLWALGRADLVRAIWADILQGALDRAGAAR